MWKPQKCYTFDFWFFFKEEEEETELRHLFLYFTLACVKSTMGMLATKTSMEVGGHSFTFLLLCHPLDFKSKVKPAGRRSSWEINVF